MENKIKNEVYCILFDEHLDNNAKFNKFVDLVEEYYNLGAKDERRAYQTLFDGDSNIEDVIDDFNF